MEMLIQYVCGDVAVGYPILRYFHAVNILSPTLGNLKFLLPFITSLCFYVILILTHLLFGHMYDPVQNAQKHRRSSRVRCGIVYSSKNRKVGN